MKFLRSFWWCLANAMLALVVLYLNLLEGGSEGWVWGMAAVIVYWIWAGRRALKRTDGESMYMDERNDEQTARITVAVRNLGKVMEEVESECKAAALARKLKEKEKKDA